MTRTKKNKNFEMRLSSLYLVLFSFLIVFGFQTKSWALIHQSQQLNEQHSAAFSFVTDTNEASIEGLKDSHNNFPFPFSSPVCPEPNPTDSEDDQDEKEKEDNIDDYFLFLHSTDGLTGNFSSIVHFNQLLRSIQCRKTLPLYSLFQSWKLHIV
ncbi:MAG: hypothetical protein RL135_2318 [Bacteroidota bacterium]|jgi:hypothetical protein